MEYRASFVFLSLANFLASAFEIAGIWVLFERFKMVRGWTLEELALIYGTIHMGFALGEGFARSFDYFGQTIKNGDFDRILLRPLGALFQVISREVQMIRVGRFLQGLLVAMWGCFKLKIPLLSFKTLVLFSAVLGNAFLFYGLFVIQATVCFWTVETLELMNIATYGGREVGQYPMNIYNFGFRLFFTFVVPLACVSYYPVASVLRHLSIPMWIGALLPLFGALFLYLACRLWQLGVKRYHSTGS